MNETDILSQAAESTARWKANQPIGPLDGVPVAVKDEFKVKGYTHTYGSNGKFVGTEPEEEDSPAVERLRAAGAILFPKANMHVRSCVHHQDFQVSHFVNHVGVWSPPNWLQSPLGWST